MGDHHSRRPDKKPELAEIGTDLMRKMDEFFYSKPSRNILDSIDSFFQNSTFPTRIPVDLYETDKEWVVKVDLPGVNKSAINVDVQGDAITISVADDQDAQAYDETKKVYHQERRYHRAERTITLPYTVDKRTTKAKFKDGVLDIRGPKKERSNNRLDIE